MITHACSFSDPRNYRISYNGKVYMFDWSDMFGPSRVNNDGRISEQGLPIRVIDAISLWRKQGKRLCPGGYCLWRPEHRDIPTYLLPRVALVTTRCLVFQEDRCA